MVIGHSNDCPVDPIPADLLRGHTSQSRNISSSALAGLNLSRIRRFTFSKTFQKGPQKCPGNWSPMCFLCCLTSLFEVFVLKPSKFIIQTTSRQKHVSWVPVTFAEINYYPHAHRTETSIRDHPSNVRSASRKYIQYYLC